MESQVKGIVGSSADDRTRAATRSVVGRLVAGDGTTPVSGAVVVLYVLAGAAGKKRWDASEIVRDGRSLGSVFTGPGGGFEIEAPAADGPETIALVAFQVATDGSGDDGVAMMAHTPRPRATSGSREAFVLRGKPQKVGPSSAQARSRRTNPSAVVQRTMKVLPLPPAVLERPDFALAGKMLSRYKAARSKDSNLPTDKSVEKVQKATVDALLEGLRTAHEALVEPFRPRSASRKRATASGTSRKQQTEAAIHVARTQWLKLTPRVRETLGLTEGTDKERKFIKFKEARAFLAPTTITAPDRPVLHAVRALVSEPAAPTGEELKREKASGDTSTDQNGTESSTPSTPTGTADEIRRYVAERLSGLHAQTVPTDFGTKRQQKPYESLDASSGLSAADAIAYHDFHDLKLAWKTPWSAVQSSVETELPEVPPLVALMLPDLLLAEWREFRVTSEAIDNDWPRLLDLSGRSAILGRTLRAYQGVPLTSSERSSLLSQLATAYRTTVTSSIFGEIDAAYGLWQSCNTWVGAPQPPAFPPGSPNFIKWHLANIALPAKIDQVTKELTSVAEEARRHIAQVAQSSNSNTLTHVGHSFRVFAPGSATFGLLVTYRQRWQPLSYQVGDLVKTIPLAPKESRKVSTRVKLTKRRSRKELESALTSRRGEDASTSNSQREIVARAQEKTSFEATARGGFQVEFADIGANAGGSTTAGVSAGKESADTKRQVREAVVKAAREFREERKVEVEEENTDESETSTASEISNPNDEITVTYLFYELERRYRITERLQKIQAVVLVACDVPSPGEIGWDWIHRHDWILRRTLLDDSFVEALAFVREGEQLLNQQVENLLLRKQEFERLLQGITARAQQLDVKASVTEAEADLYSKALAGISGAAGNDMLVENVAEWIFGDSAGAQAAEKQALKDAALERLDRLRTQQQQAHDEIAAQRGQVAGAVEQFNQAVQERNRKFREVERLIKHLTQNILYYLKAIWAHEPTDQRYLRLMDVVVPFVPYPADGEDVLVSIGDDDELDVLFPPPPAIDYRPLTEVADVYDLLGFKGNCAMFPLRQQSYLTAYLAQDYVDGYATPKKESRGVVDKPSLYEMVAIDPDTKGMQAREMSLAAGIASQAAKTVSIGSATPPSWGAFDKTVKDAETTLQQAIDAGYLDSQTESAEIVVPLDNLYIEALPGKHPLLEDFKLRHREIDVRKVEAEVEALRINNLRAEARLLQLDFTDPEVDRNVRVDVSPIAIQPPAK